jgi:hypothetical protein
MQCVHVKTIDFSILGNTPLRLQRPPQKSGTRPETLVCLSVKLLEALSANV